MADETITFIGSHGPIEMTRREISLATQFAVTQNEVLRVIGEDPESFPEILLKIIHLGTLLERADPTIVETLVGAFAKTAGTSDLTEFNHKAAKIVQSFMSPMSDESWERAKEQFKKQNREAEELSQLEEVLFGRREDDSDTPFEMERPENAETTAPR